MSGRRSLLTSHSCPHTPRMSTCRICRSKMSRSKKIACLGAFLTHEGLVGGEAAQVRVRAARGYGVGARWRLWVDQKSYLSSRRCRLPYSGRRGSRREFPRADPSRISRLHWYTLISPTLTCRDLNRHEIPPLHAQIRRCPASGPGRMEKAGEEEEDSEHGDLMSISPSYACRAFMPTAIV